MENLRSTFPLDESAIVRQALGKILTDPITWAPLIPPVAAYAIFDVPAFLSLGAGAAVFACIVAYWRKQWAGILQTYRHQWIAAHNHAQDATLQKAADELRLAKQSACAQKLEQVLAIKRKIEARIHEDGEITPQKAQLEQLVDSLCFGVRDQLQTLILKEGLGEPVDRHATLQQVDTALETLQSTAADIDVILGPAEALAGSGNASLDEITRRLREEAEIAHRVQARLRAQSADLSAPPSSEGQ